MMEVCIAAAPFHDSAAIRLALADRHLANMMAPCQSICYRSDYFVVPSLPVAVFLIMIYSLTLSSLLTHE